VRPAIDMGDSESTFGAREGGRSAIVLWVIGVAVAAWLWWLCARRPDINFLVRHEPAEWIVFPLPANPMAQQNGPCTTAFRREFSLDRIPAHAPLRVRALGQIQLKVNDSLIPLSQARPANWKDAAEVDAAGSLRAGANHIEATINNDRGPEALWLTLGDSPVIVASDSRWSCSIAGSSWAQARSAEAPMPIRPGNSLAGGQKTAEVWPSTWPLMGALGVLAAALVICWERWGKAKVLKWAPKQRRNLGIGIVAGLFLILFFNNNRLLPYPVGFDAAAHLDYIRYIQQNASLPLADEGWELHQPPLYYVVSTLALTLCNISLGMLGPSTATAIVSPGALTVLRLVNLAAVLAQIALVWGALKLVFPKDRGAQLAGGIFIVCLPMQLYMAHFASNDIFAATMGCGAVYLCLRVLHDPQPSTGMLVGLGICLGAALLSKTTTMGLAPVVVAVLAGRLIAGREWKVHAWFRQVGIPVLACLVVSGWHFARVWSRFGTPLVGSFDPASGFTWWQHQGYNTTAYFTRFGQALWAPFFSEFNGFMDGIYSTLYGDALWAGVAEPRGRVPWNYDLMVMGYWLALVPTLLIALGLVATLVDLVRRPSAEWFLILGWVFTMSLAVLFHYLRLPYMCHVKAFYALPAAIGLALLLARGMQLVGKRPWSQAVLVAFLGWWGVTAYATYWIRSGAAATEAAMALSGRTDPRQALKHFQNAVTADSSYEYGMLGLGSALIYVAREPTTGLELLKRDVQLHPESAMAWEMLATILHAQGQPGALEAAKEAVDKGPDSARAHGRYGILLSEAGRSAEAIDQYREAIACWPGEAQMHLQLGKALAKRRRYAEAIEQFRMAHQWMPEDIEAATALARLLASAPAAEGGSAEEGLGVAKEGAALLRQMPHAEPLSKIMFLDSLAIASANTGHFPEAVQAVRQALALVQIMTSPQFPAPDRHQAEELAADLRKRLALFESNQPYRDVAGSH
jgi:tetratricopeptide (TPR) repeat protein